MRRGGRGSGRSEPSSTSSSQSGVARVALRSERPPPPNPGSLSIPRTIRPECSSSFVVFLISEDIKQVEGCSASAATFRVERSATSPPCRLQDGNDSK